MNSQFNQKINKFVKQIPNYRTKDLVIYYVYRNLAPFFQRDISFFLANPSLQTQIYQNGFTMNGSNVVCKTICKYYGRVFKRIHIEFKIITTNEKEVPHFAMLVHGDKGWYFIDPLKDLLVNQLGCRTNFFGVKTDFGTVSKEYPSLVTLDEDYLFSLASQTGSLSYGHFFDFFIELIHHEFFHCNDISFLLDAKNDISLILAKLNFCSQYLINIHSIPGLCERRQYYSYLKRQIFNKFEKKKVKISIVDSSFLQFSILGDNGEEIANFREVCDNDSFYSLKRMK